MVERNLEKERADLKAIRISLGPPSTEERSYFVKNIIPKMHFAPEEFNEAIERLSEFKSTIEKHNINFSRPALCSKFIYVEMNGYFMDLIKEALNDKDMAGVRFRYDFLEGIERATAIILVGDNELSEVGESNRLQSLSSQENSDYALSEKAGAYIWSKTRARNYSNILIKDPSGFLLMDFGAEETQADLDSGLYGPLCREYVLGGAQLARDLYKEVYKIAAPLYPEKQQK
ncbi:MAG: hypothetical protein A3B47_03650 [Candidatus Levybacteria bacterium RIFCSPLOWO2_01_FULL_39_24]|nr:MAG: hypothetical protein A2800_03455 [Candidatus Levybacteria bacterium RIFCSPHIGHO2_01_FULL_40_16]OGH28149.1 MAG: hypothetical protein A3E12_04155 [Candidatus Levybacteria bacterium RIFCSPHIGHO2_12_FULL_39_9]OGH46334.1 MAG: hypothetical protein A3B47_03650 [Candidatus Levybacteria bacterium RIFCSPLOWO2_01_FULL_39_24]